MKERIDNLESCAGDERAYQGSDWNSTLGALLAKVDAQPARVNVPAAHSLPLTLSFSVALTSPVCVKRSRRAGEHNLGPHRRSATYFREAVIGGRDSSARGARAIVDFSPKTRKMRELCRT